MARFASRRRVKTTPNNQLARRARIVAWLREQPEFRALPGRHADMTDDGRIALAEIDRRMMDARLVSRQSPAADRIWSLRSLVTEAQTGVKPQ